MIPVKFDRAYHSAEWQRLVALCIGAPREAVEEFVNGVLLAALLAASGGGVLCQVSFTIPVPLDLKLRFPTRLCGGMDFFYLHHDEDPVAELAQEAREEQTGLHLAAACEMQGLTKRQRARFRIRFAWRPVERSEFEEWWEAP